MRIDDLIRLDEAPAAGNLLAYTRKKVFFQPYESLEKIRKIFSEEDLLELHLFDSEKEYRCIMTRSLRYESGIIEAVIDFSDQNDMDVYSENVLLEHSDSGEKITILNHLKYHEENGMVTVDNYRLKRGEA